MANESRVVRRTYKDTVFRDLYGSQDRKGYTLELYNALNGTSYGDPEMVTINTLGDALFIGVRNDVSFVIGDELNLWEQQSTHNPNMPLRGLEYFSALYSKEMGRLGSARYSARRIDIPTPRFVVFYTGVQERADYEEVFLSDSFEGEGDLEVRARVLNINAGHNPGLMARSESLAGYSRLVELVRERRSSGADLDDAVMSAVRECLSEGILEEYLRERREAVIGMFIGQMSKEEAEAEMREAFYKDGRDDGYKDGHDEGYKEGIEQGIEQGIAQSVRALMKVRGMSQDEAMNLLAVPEGRREAVASLL